MSDKAENSNPQPRLRISNGLTLLVLGGLVLIGVLYALHVNAGRKERLPPLLFVMVTPLVVLGGVKFLVDYAFQSDKARGWVCPRCQGSGKVALTPEDKIESCRACAGNGRITG
ncbi:MAG: hypothetical protein ACFCD0_25335 [Gemmataceae bacterium]